MQGARNLISCSEDGRLRDISLLNEFQSIDFSRKNLKTGRLQSERGDGLVGSVRSFDFSHFREQDWQNVLSCSKETNQPLMWSSANHSISKVKVEQND